MTIQSRVAPVGSGQEGAVPPTAAGDDIPVHIEGEQDNAAEKRLDQAANRAASQGINRQQREDPTEFTK
jgi:hypothetical protein